MIHSSCCRSHKPAVSKTNLPQNKVGHLDGPGLLWDAVRKEQALGRLPGSQVHSQMDSPIPEGDQPAWCRRAPGTGAGRSPPSSAEKERKKLVRGLPEGAVGELRVAPEIKAGWVLPQASFGGREGDTIFKKERPAVSELNTQILLQLIHLFRRYRLEILPLGFL